MVSNLADLIRDSADEHPASVAIVDVERKATYAGLDDHVTGLAKGLVAKGLEPGDRVALLLGNTYEFVVAFFGVLRAGGIAVPLNTSLAADEVRHAVETTGPRLLISDSGNSHTLADAELGRCPVLVAGSGDWTKLIQANGDVALPEDTDPEAIAVLLFTSGTAGRPRAAMLTHRALLANVSALIALDDPAAITSKDVSLAVLPLFHVYSLNTILVCGLAVGATVVLCRRFDSRQTLETIEKHKVTVVAGAPPMYVGWSAEEGLREAFADTRLALSGAAPLAPALFDQFRTVTGKPIWEGYGLTECSPVVSTALVSGSPKAGSVGRPLANVEIKIVPEFDDQPGVTIDGLDDADESDPGEIWVRAPSLFSGYWPNRDDGPDADGWFGTGDVGYLDADGDLTLVDRRSELVIVSGFNVYPREVERVIEDHPSVAECAVFGVAHPYSGEAVKAVVSLVPGAEMTTDELVGHCEERLARFKCPTIVEVVDAMPRSPTGKIAKHELRSP